MSGIVDVLDDRITCGGVIASNHLYNVAPQDGTILTIVSQGLAVDQGLGLNPSFQADLRAFNWVGNVSSAGQVVVAWHTAPVKTLDDAMRREIVIGGAHDHDGHTGGHRDE